MKTKQQRKDEAYEEYKKIRNPAYEEYKKIENSAWEEYREKCQEIDGEMKTIKEMWELFCDWQQAEITEKSNAVLAECLDYDIDKAIENMKQECYAQALKDVEENGINGYEDFYGFVCIKKEKLAKLAELKEVGK